MHNVIYFTTSQLGSTNPDKPILRARKLAGPVSHAALQMKQECLLTPEPVFWFSFSDLPVCCYFPLFHLFSGQKQAATLAVF